MPACLGFENSTSLSEFVFLLQDRHAIDIREGACLILGGAQLLSFSYLCNTDRMGNPEYPVVHLMSGMHALLVMGTEGWSQALAAAFDAL